MLEEPGNSGIAFDQLGECENPGHRCLTCRHWQAEMPPDVTLTGRKYPWCRQWTKQQPPCLKASWWSRQNPAANKSNTTATCLEGTCSRCDKHTTRDKHHQNTSTRHLLNIKLTGDQYLWWQLVTTHKHLRYDNTKCVGKHTQYGRE